MSRSGYVDLANLTDDDLSDLVREREKAFGDALAELGRRKDWYGCNEWSDEAALALVAEKRARRDVPRRPNGTAPAMFRAGYEWATLAIFFILESILDKPSEDAVLLSEYKPVGRGLYRFDKTAQVFDPRRRAALDLINLLEGFVSIDLRALFALPTRRSAYRPSDDETANWVHPPKAPEGPL
jgi:hypothetical protein